MSTVITHPAVDAVVLGEGVMGGEITVKLTLAGLRSWGSKRVPTGTTQTDFAITKYDEYGIQIMRKNDHPLAMSTLTLRNNSTQFALPVRRNTTGQGTSSGHGVGGAAHHYGAHFGRYEPWTYAIHSNTISKYGQAFLTPRPQRRYHRLPQHVQRLSPILQRLRDGLGGLRDQPGAELSGFGISDATPSPDSRVCSVPIFRGIVGHY